MRRKSNSDISSQVETNSNLNEGLIPIKPLKAIRLKCIDCCAGSESEVKKCNISYCSLYPFRFGKNPYHKKASIKTKEKAGITYDNEEEIEENDM